jgi:hypothetical protein
VAAAHAARPAQGRQDDRRGQRLPAVQGHRQGQHEDGQEGLRRFRAVLQAAARRHHGRPQGRPILFGEWVFGDGWSALGGVPVFSASLPTATPTTTGKATFTFADPTGTGDPFTITAQSTIDDGVTWLTATLDTPGAVVTASGNTTVKVKSVAAGSTKFRVGGRAPMAPSPTRRSPTRSPSPNQSLGSAMPWPTSPCRVSTPIGHTAVFGHSKGIGHMSENDVNEEETPSEPSRCHARRLRRRSRPTTSADSPAAQRSWRTSRARSSSPERAVARRRPTRRLREAALRPQSVRPQPRHRVAGTAVREQEPDGTEVETEVGAHTSAATSSSRTRRTASSSSRRTASSWP